MRLPFVPILIFIIVNVLTDLYIYKKLKQRVKSKRVSLAQSVVTIGLYVLMAVIICWPKKSCSTGMLTALMWMIYTYITVYISKYIAVIVDLIAKIPCLFGRARIKPLSILAGIFAIGTFGMMWWGALVNRFNIDLTEVQVEIEGLPDEFDGYRMVQFSDLHVGTYQNDTTFVAELVDSINALHPDLIVFTGDIVNSKTSELLPHTSPLSRLKATDGVYSILGNHDYGDYSTWKTAEAKQENLDLLKKLQADMGWNLLLNETEMIRRGNDSIALIGVENIGDPPFTIYGSLQQAYKNTSDSVTKILLTHNPSHWSDSIANRNDVRIALSLSGHTHAMQFKLFGWSPAKFRYKTWGGLYDDNSNYKHQLYVNIGIGTVGFPSRIGATPEVSIFTLKKK